MFIIPNECIVATFLHPNYRQLRGATPTQITDCYQKCRSSFLPADPSANVDEDEDEYSAGTTDEPQPKKAKLLMTKLMDKQSNKKKQLSDAIDQYINLPLEPAEVYTNPLEF